MKLGAILFLIVGICVGALSVVNHITAPVIAMNEVQTEENEMKALLSDAETFSLVDETGAENVEKVYRGMAETEPVGYVVRMTPNGYGGEIKFLVALDMEKSVKGISILEHSETPGFGANAEKDSFKEQFIDCVIPIAVTKTEPKENEIQAITGATITSQAITNAINEAGHYIEMHQAEWGNE